MAFFDAQQYQPDTQYDPMAEAMAESNNPSGGILGMLRNPRTQAALAAMSQGFAAAGAPNRMRNGGGAMYALSQGLSAGAAGAQSWEEEQAKAAASRLMNTLNARKTMAETTKLEKEAASGGGPFAGSGMDAQVANILINPDISPDSLEWKIAYDNYMQPKVSFDGATGRMVTVTPPKIPEIEARRAGSRSADGPVVTTEKVAEGGAEQAAAAAAKAASEKETNDRTWKLRGEHDKAISSLADYSTKLSQAKALINGNVSGVADVALVNTFQKLIDEGSVVREGDVALLSSTGGAFGTLKQIAGNFRQGQKLSPQVRKQMLDTLNVLESEFNKRRMSVSGSYRQQASDFGLDPDMIVPTKKKKETQPAGNRPPMRL